MKKVSKKQITSAFVWQGVIFSGYFEEASSSARQDGFSQEDIATAVLKYVPSIIDLCEEYTHLPGICPYEIGKKFGGWWIKAFVKDEPLPDENSCLKKIKEFIDE